MGIPSLVAPESVRLSLGKPTEPSLKEDSLSIIKNLQFALVREVSTSNVVVRLGLPFELYKILRRYLIFAELNLHLFAYMYRTVLMYGEIYFFSYTKLLSFQNA